MEDTGNEANMLLKRKRKLTDNNETLNVKERRTEHSDREAQSTEEKVSVRKDSVKSTIDTADVTDSPAHTEPSADETTSQDESHNMPQINTAEKKHDVSVTAKESERDERIDIVSLSKLNVAKEEPVCVKRPEDESDCSMTGIDVLNDGRLVIADGSNRNIKLFDQNRHPLSTFAWPWSTVVGYGPNGVAANNSDKLYVIFWKSVKALELKQNQFSDKGTFFFHGNYIKCITVHQGSVFILTSTDMHASRRYVMRIDNRGRSFWAVPVNDDSYGSPFRNLFDTTIRGHGFFLSSFAHEGKVHVLLSGSRKGKLDGESVSKLATEDVDFSGPVSFGRGVVYFSYCHSNEIFASIPKTNEKRALINLPNAPYQISHMGTRRSPRPLTYEINCLKYSPTNDQLLVSYGPYNPNPNYIDCLQLQTVT